MLEVFWGILYISLCAIPHTLSTYNFNEILTEINTYHNYLINVRRQLHQTPETRFEEYNTSHIIKQTLSDNNITYTGGWGVDSFYTERGGTGIVADIGTGHPPCVLIRADIDALPIYEEVDVPYKSKRDGYMHACGHDAHTTMLLGAAIYLKQHEDELEGTVRVMFSPAEEGGGGVKMMIDEGVMTKYPPPQRAFGFHISPNLPTGVIYSKGGYMTTASDYFTVHMKGKGGHGAMPHTAIDPFPPSLATIKAFYDLYARETYFHEKHSALLGIAFIKGGMGAVNVLPNEVVFGGTIQAVTDEKFDSVKKRMQKITHSVAAAYECTSTISFRNTSYPSVYNDPEFHSHFKQFCQNCSVSGQIEEGQLQYGGDDFGFFSSYCPSIYTAIGVGSGHEIEGHPPTSFGLHSSKFCLDERVLTRGAATHATVVYNSLKYLNEHS